MAHLDIDKKASKLSLLITAIYQTFFLLVFLYFLFYEKQWGPSSSALLIATWSQMPSALIVLLFNELFSMSHNHHVAIDVVLIVLMQSLFLFYIIKRIVKRALVVRDDK
jgi:hypothetical protein